MLVHCDQVGFRGDCIENFRLSYPGCLLRTDCSQQGISNKKNVGQRHRHEDTVAVLDRATIAHLGEAEDPLDHTDRVLDPRPDPERDTLAPITLPKAMSWPLD